MYTCLVKLINGYILIRVDEEVVATQSGLLLQKDTVKLPSTGTIENIDDSVVGLKVGDKVEFLRYASIDGLDKDTRFCTKDMILAVL